MKSEAKALQKSPNDKAEYLYGELPNKLQYFLVSDAETEESSIALRVRVGSMAEPQSIPGLAHLLEHMLFMGSELFKDPGEFANFITQNGGQNNAYTELYETVYYFTIVNDKFEEAIARFASFFTCSLLNPDWIREEAQIVNSEHESNLANDDWKQMQMKRHVSNPKSTYNGFSTGTAEKLNRPDIYQQLKDFYNSKYSANLMNLVVYSEKAPEHLKKLISEHFSAVKNKNLPEFTYNSEENAAVTSKEINRLVKLQSENELNKLSVNWYFPFRPENYNCNPLSIFGHLLGHEGVGSLLSGLKSEHLATNLMAGDCSLANIQTEFTVEIELTEEGWNNIERVMQYFGSYIRMLRANASQFETYFAELKKILDVRFENFEKEDPESRCLELVARSVKIPYSDHLIAPFRLDKFDPVKNKEILHKLTIENSVVYLVNSQFSEELSQKEPIYQTPFSVAEIPLSYRKAWNEEPKEPLHALRLPDQNKFLPSMFRMLSLKNIDTKLIRNAPNTSDGSWTRFPLLLETDPVNNQVSSIANNSKEKAIHRQMQKGYFQKIKMPKHDFSTKSKTPIQHSIDTSQTKPVQQKGSISNHTYQHIPQQINTQKLQIPLKPGNNEVSLNGKRLSAYSANSTANNIFSPKRSNFQTVSREKTPSTEYGLYDGDHHRELTPIVKQINRSGLYTHDLPKNPQDTQKIANNRAKSVNNSAQNANQTATNVSASKLGKTWFKQDNKYSVPKSLYYAYIRLNMQDLCSYEDSRVYLELYVGIMNEYLNELNYLAQMAAVEIKIKAARKGINMSISGYSDSFKSFLPEFGARLSKYSQLSTNVDGQRFLEANFSTRKQDLIRSKQNKLAAEPYNAALNSFEGLLVWNVESEDDYLQRVKKANFETFMHFHKNILKSVFYDELFYGNTQPTDAITMSKKLRSNFYEAQNSQPLPIALWAKNNVIKLPEKTTIVVAKDAGNPNETNSASLVLYQADNRFESQFFVSILENLIAQKFYDDLRTKQQLGYIVLSSAYDTRGIHGFYFAVQSDTANSSQIALKIHEFVQNFKAQLKTLTNADFEDVRQALLVNSKEKYTNLSNEADYYWDQIVKSRNNFSFKEQAQKFYQNVTRTDFQLFVNDLFYVKSRVLELHFSAECSKSASLSHLEERKKKNALHQSIDNILESNKLIVVNSEKQLKTLDILKSDKQTYVDPQFPQSG